MLASLTESMFTDRQAEGRRTEELTGDQKSLLSGIFRWAKTHFYYYIRGMMIFRKN